MKTNRLKKNQGKYNKRYETSLHKGKKKYIIHRLDQVKEGNSTVRTLGSY